MAVHVGAAGGTLMLREHRGWGVGVGVGLSVPRLSACQAGGHNAQSVWGSGKTWSQMENILPTTYSFGNLGQVLHTVLEI